MKNLILIIAGLLLLAACKNQMDEKPRFYKTEEVKYKDICADGCGHKMPMTVEGVHYEANGHIDYFLLDNSIPKDTVYAMDYQLQRK